MSPTRGIDHLVVAVRDLAAARDRYARFGFVTTPLGRQPWGTANHLVQFPANFIELVGVLDSAGIVPASEEHFSFSAAVAGFLERREGLCMLVLTTADARADADEWRSRGLRAYPPYHWSRRATLPDGTDTTVAFTLAFVTDPDLPGIAFFSCQQHNPEAFWKPEYQAHDNGARGVGGVTLVVEDPPGHARFVADLVGNGRPAEAADGVRIQTANGAIRVQSPEAFSARFPRAGVRWQPGEVALAAATVTVDDPDRAAACLETGGIPFFRGEDTVYLAPDRACGVVLEFSAG